MPVEAKNAYSVQFNLGMPLYDAELYKNIAIAKKGSEIVKIQKEQLQKELTFQIKKAYLDIFLSDENLKFQNETLKRNQFLLQEAKNRLKQGLNTPVDTLKVFVEKSNTTAEIIKIKNQIKLLKQNFQKTIGLDEDFEVANEIENNQINNLETKLNIENRSDFKIAKVSAEIAKLEYEKATLAYLPKLNLIGQYQQQTQADNFRFREYNWPENYFLGVQLTVPIFAGFNTKIKREQTKMLIDKTALQNQQLQKNATAEIEASINDIETVKLRLQTVKLGFDASNRSYQLVNDQYKNGFVRYSDVNDAEIMLKESNIAILTAKYDYWISIFNYQKINNY